MLAFAANVATVAPMMAKLIVALRSAIIAQTGLNVAMSLNPVGLVVAAIVVLIGTLYLLIKYFDQIRDFFQSGLGKAVAVALVAFAPFLILPITLIMAWEPIKNFFTQTLPSAFQAGVSFIGQVLQQFKDNFWGTIGAIIGFMATLPIKMPYFMIMALQNVIAAVLNVNWGAVFSGIWQAMQRVWDAVVNAAVSALHRIQGLPWGSLAAGIGKSVGNALISMIEGALKGALKGLPGNLSAKINLPRFAKGVKNFEGGAAIVGEEGAEIVNLPRGSDVIPNNKISSAGSGGDIIIKVEVGMYAGTEIEKRKIGLELFKAAQEAAAAKGTTVNQVLGI